MRWDMGGEGERGKRMREKGLQILRDVMERKRVLKRVREMDRERNRSGKRVRGSEAKREN